MVHNRLSGHRSFSTRRDARAEEWRSAGTSRYVDRRVPSRSFIGHFVGKWNKARPVEDRFAYFLGCAWQKESRLLRVAAMTITIFACLVLWEILPTYDWERGEPFSV